MEKNVVVMRRKREVVEEGTTSTSTTLQTRIVGTLTRGRRKMLLSAPTCSPKKEDTKRKRRPSNGLIMRYLTNSESLALDSNSS